MLTIPQRFKDGLDKKVSTVYPIVVITSVSDTIRLSQKKGLFDGEYYEDRDLRLSAIKESINIADKNFKTSQITISLCNYIYNNERFTDRFSNFSFINSDVSIYYANANCKAIADCLLIFKGFIKDYKGGKDKISFNVEDHSQYTLDDKTFPRYKTYDPAAETIESSKNAFFPVTYGHHEKAPLIFSRSNRMNTLSTIYPDSVFREDIEIGGFLADSAEDEGIITDPSLSVFREDEYHRIPQKVEGLPDPFVVNGKNYSDGQTGYEGSDQYQFDNNTIVLNKKIQDDGHSYGLTGNLQAREEFLVETSRKVTGVSADDSATLDWGDSPNQSQYIGSNAGYDVIEISSPESDQKEFKFPEVSNPASLIEEGVYRDMTLKGFNWGFKGFIGTHYWTYEFPTNYSIYHLSWIYNVRCQAINNGKKGFDMLYVPDIEEINGLGVMADSGATEGQDSPYTVVEWTYATDLVYYWQSSPYISGADNLANPGHFWGNTAFHWAFAPSGGPLGWVDFSDAYRWNSSEISDGAAGSTNNSSYKGLLLSYATLDENGTLDIAYVNLGLDEDASAYFKSDVYAWITEEGETPTLRKILWGRRVFHDSATQGTDEAQGKFNKGCWVYGLFPTLGYNTIKDFTILGRWSDFQTSRRWAGYETQFRVDSLYSFKNPYLVNPEDPLNYDGFNTLTESLGHFDHATLDGSKLVPMGSKADGHNEGEAIINWGYLADDQSEFDEGITLDGEEFGPTAFYDPAMPSPGNASMWGGNWCPLSCNSQVMEMVKINLTFNSIGGSDVIEGGVFSRVRGKVMVNFAKTGPDSISGDDPEFSVELDSLNQDNDRIIEVENIVSSLDSNPINVDTLEPPGYSILSTGVEGDNDEFTYATSADIDFDATDSTYIFTECDRHAGQLDDNGDPIPDQWREGVNTINSFSLIYSINQGSATNSTSGMFNSIISNFELYQKYIIQNISKQKYFGNLRGRIDNLDGKYTGTSERLIEKPSDIMLHIMEKEFGYYNESGFDSSSIDFARDSHVNWKFAFSVDEETPAKEFVKDFAKSTKFVPRFRHDGTLSLINITETIAASSTINSSDVIDFSYSKTPLSEVKLMVQVNYKYDNGLKDYQACTDLGNGGIVSVDTESLMDMYGIKSLDDAFLRFDSKYIRDEVTAKKLRNYLLEWFKNQHNIIECTLPVSYMYLECGDVINFDSLIQDMLIFGKDYTSPFAINDHSWSQIALSDFMVQEISKSQQKVKVQLIQLHQIDYSHLSEGFSLTESSEGFWIPAELVEDVEDTGDDDEGTTTTTYNLGDWNQDTLVNILDVVAIIQYIVSETDASALQVAIADVSGDGSVNILDIVILVQYIIGEGDDLGTTDGV